MPRALFVSPHFDDVAFSCGGIAAALARAGWATTLLTVFTRSVRRPRGFALACQRDKGLDADTDYMALRTEEDNGAAALLAFESVVRLDLLEAPHRGYESPAALFGPFQPKDDVVPELSRRLATHIARYDLVLAPQALGAHVDHRRVRDACVANPGSAGIAWYRDTPYAIRDPQAEPAIPALAALGPVAIPLAAASLGAKLEACAAYTSQLGFQFGGVPSMRQTLSDFADAEGARFGARGPAEVVRTVESLGRMLGALWFDSGVRVGP